MIKMNHHRELDIINNRFVCIFVLLFTLRNDTLYTQRNYSWKLLSKLNTLFKVYLSQKLIVIFWPLKQMYYITSSMFSQAAQKHAKSHHSFCLKETVVSYDSLVTISPEPDLFKHISRYETISKVVVYPCVTLQYLAFIYEMTH